MFECNTQLHAGVYTHVRLPCHASKALIHPQPSRLERRFEGIVATDCGALADADTKHNYSAHVCPRCDTPQLRAEKIAQLAVEAGVDSNCGSFLGDNLPAVVARRQIDPAVLEASTARLLAHRFRLGLFEPDHPGVPRFGIEHIDSAGTVRSSVAPFCATRPGRPIVWAGPPSLYMFAPRAVCAPKRIASSR